MAPDTGFVQVIQYVKRNPKLTREQFWDQWQTVHAPKFIPFAEGSGIRRYQQVSPDRPQIQTAEVITSVVTHPSCSPPRCAHRAR